MSIKAGERVKASPALAAFAKQARRRISPDDHRTFWGCASLFKELLRTRFVTDLVNDELEQMAGDAVYVPAGGSSEFHLSVLMEERFSLTVGLVEPGVRMSSSLYSTTEHYMLGVAAVGGNGSVDVEMFTQPEPEPCDVFDRRRRLVRKGQQRLEPGDVALFRAGADLFRLTPSEKPSVMLVFTSGTVAPLRWQYDSETLHPLRAISASPTASRLDYVARLLAEISDASSVPALKSLLDHEDHFVRWSAVRGIMRLDHAEGLAAVRAALEDPHPHVRNAARKALHRVALERRHDRRRPVDNAGARTEGEATST
ncbi:HEAT repeat domain-containing protein [Sorangium sp. So ce1389]|uniref:HEAT repeat domain-containing protein n=1 Tax=Sorangium sp. So ce1389 TaxID=3133336 RepID=UPI003F63D0E7